MSTQSARSSRSARLAPAPPPRRATTWLLGGVVALAVGALAYVTVGGGLQRGAPLASDRRGGARDPDAAAPALGAGEGAPDGDGAPTAEAFADLVRAGASPPDPETAARHLQDLGRLARELAGRVEARDWEAVRELTEAIRRDPDALVPATAEAIATAPDPREALALGLAAEELVAEGELDAAARARLGEALVPRLGEALRTAALGAEATDHALRLLSRFPEAEGAEAALLAVLEERGAPPERRLLALYSLAEVGGSRAAAAIETVFATALPADPELARVAALALHRIAARQGDAALAGRVDRLCAPRLRELLGPAALGDPDLFARLVGTLSALARVRPELYLAAGVVPDSALPAEARWLALETLGAVAGGDAEALEALEAVRGRLGHADLEALLEAVLARLRGGDR